MNEPCLHLALIDGAKKYVHTCTFIVLNYSSNLARTACLPRGQCVLLMWLFFHFYRGRNSFPVISGSAGIIFTKFSPNGRYLIVDYSSDLFSDRSRDVAVATNFRGKIGILIFIRHPNSVINKNNQKKTPDHINRCNIIVIWFSSYWWMD